VTVPRHRYGKLPATDFGEDNVLLSHVLAEALPQAPSVFGFGRMFGDWGMLANDRVGDCAWAGPAHETMAWTGIGNAGRRSAVFDDACVLADYSACTGYDPNAYDPATGQNPTDRGTSVSALMDYRRTRGIGDASGKRHTIDLAVRLEPVGGPFDWNTFRDAVHTFGCVAVGTALPESAEQQFELHERWSYRAGSPILGGHYVPAIGSVAIDEITVVTWGRRQEMGQDFFEAYVDELWIPLSLEAMSFIERALSTVDWDRVRQIAASLGG
jgi:hypothetical protein